MKSILLTQMKNLIIIATLLLGTITTIAQSHSAYSTRYNSFAQFSSNNQAHINGDFLQLDNTSDNYIIIDDTTHIDPFTPYKYYLRFANKHSKEGKFYKVKDSSGNSLSMKSTKCGIVFNHSSNNYWMVTIDCQNTNLYNESVDKRFMNIELTHVINGVQYLVDKTSVDKAINLDENLNYLGVQVDDQSIRVLVGKDKLNESLIHNFTAEEKAMSSGVDVVHVGYAVGPGALISIERAVLTTSEPLSRSNNLHTSWTREALDRHFAISKNPYEGYWTYLDRDMEDTWLKLGGRYTIALVETENGYDVIYIDGAQVKKSQWVTGMKKAEMNKTIFTDNFNGKWFDATLEAIDQDVYVTFESGVILSFKFPVYKSQVRFSKVLK